MCKTCKQYGVLPEYEMLLHHNDKSSTTMQGEVADENDLTNTIFFKRHPELQGRKLTRTQPDFDKLRKEWLQIRDMIVRPGLPSDKNTSGGSQASTTTINPNMPPVESPSNFKPVIGYRCASGRKCWSGAKSIDIADTDAPWNKPDNRSAANYISVLDYFNVGETDSQGKGNSIIKPGENPRYRQLVNIHPVTGKKTVSTYCNIYAHDVTRAMWASIPHWIPMGRRNELNELTANDMAVWLATKGQENGWIPINGEMLQWLSRQASSGGDVPPPSVFYSGNLRMAGRRVSASADRSLMNQPAYVAQQFANLGLPTVAIWNNRGGIGHIAMIRPEESNKKGKVENGMFRPRSAQAGASNYSSGPLVFGSSALKSGKILFYVHE